MILHIINSNTCTCTTTHVFLNHLQSEHEVAQYPQPSEDTAAQHVLDPETKGKRRPLPSTTSVRPICTSTPTSLNGDICTKVSNSREERAESLKLGSSGSNCTDVFSTLPVKLRETRGACELPHLRYSFSRYSECRSHTRAVTSMRCRTSDSRGKARSEAFSSRRQRSCHLQALHGFVQGYVAAHLRNQWSIPGQYC